MVFESIVTDLLNRFLGDFIENLDGKQLNIGIWGGDVVLRDLKLKQDALKDLDLPVTTVYGHLGTLVLKIPWKNLYSLPVVVDIEDLYLLVAPNAAVSYDAVKAEASILAAKITELDAYEAAKKRDKEKENPVANKSFTEKMVAQIINNVQIKIRNVHIRYEDVSTSTTPFALGITLGSLEVHTTDHDWQKTFLAEALSKVFKVAKLDGLAVYMNCGSTMFGSQAVHQYNDLFLETIARQDFMPDKYHYVLGPINAMAKLKLNMNPELDKPSFNVPKIDLSLEMKTLAIGITKSQYQRLIELADGFGAMNRGFPYRKYRPYNTPIKGNARIWWRFALTCVLEDIKKQHRLCSWSHIKEHRSLCREYAEVYQTKLIVTKCPSDVALRQNALEERLDLFNLQMIRQRVSLEVEMSGVLDKIKPEAKGWFGGWLGWGSSEQSNEKTGTGADIMKQFKSAMTSDEKEKLFSAIGYDETDTVTDMPSDYVAVAAYFKLQLLELRISNDNMLSTDSFEITNVLTFMMEEVSCAIDQRPSSSGLKVDMHMRELTVLGQKQEERLPIMVKSRINELENQLDVLFEMNPVDKLCDQRIVVHSRQLEIVYDAVTIIQLLQIFKTSSDTNLSELTDVAADKISDFKERSATGIQYMVEKKPRLEVSVSIMPNYIVMPYGGAYIRNVSPVMVIGLGQLTLKSSPQTDRLDVAAMHTSGHSQADIMQRMMEQAYDKFSLDIQNIQILLASAGEQWEQCLVDDNVTGMHILEPTALYVSVELCLVDDDPRLPKTKVSAKIPSVGFSIGDTKVLDALALGMSIPLPENDTIEPKPLEKSKTSSLVLSSMSIKRFLEEKQIRKFRKADGARAEPTHEIAQYTDLEFTFVLQELSINIYRAKDADSITTASYVTPSEEFTSLIVPTSPSSRSEALNDLVPERRITIKVNQLEMDLTQRTYDMNVSLKLGAISMNQYRAIDDNKVLPMIDTPTYANKSGYLFALNYTSANKTSPEFTTKYKSVEQCIDINFTVLIVRLHQERLVELLQIVAEFQNKIENIVKSQNRDRVADAGEPSHVRAIGAVLATIAEEGSMSNVPVKVSKASPRVVDSIKLQVIAKMEKVAIILESDLRQVAELKIEKLQAGVIIKSSYTDISLVLQDIVVNDLKSQTIHPTIMSIVGGNALTCKVIIYNVDQTLDYNQDDMAIDVSMGCARIVFLNWFVTSCLNFLDHFQTAQQAIANAGAAAAETAKHNMVHAYENQQRMRLNIQIKAPIILVPVSSNSRKAIAIDLGYLAITNLISKIPNTTTDEKTAILDEVKLELKDVKLSKIYIEDSTNQSALTNKEIDARLAGLKTQGAIIDPTTFALLVQRNLSASWYKGLPELDVSARLKSIMVNLMPDDYALLMSILSNNLSEGADERTVLPSTPSPQHVKKTATADVVNNPSSATADIQVHDPSSDDDENWNVEMLKLKALNAFGGNTNSTAHKKEVRTDTFVKFAFQMDSIIVNLSKDSNDGIASFGIHYLSLKGRKLIDGSLSASIVLCDMQMDDIRPNRENCITKYMKKKDNIAWPQPNRSVNISEHQPESDSHPEPSMVDMVIRMTDDEMFLQLKVSSFDLIISLEFILQLLQFLQFPQEQEEKNKLIVPVTTSVNVQDHNNKVLEAAGNGKKTTIILQVEQPDIILVEQMDDINCFALFFNTEIKLRIRMVDSRQTICGEIADLKLYVCEFNPERRGQTNHYVLQPCNVSLNATTPDARGMNISLTTSDIRLNISPGIIELLNKAVVTLTGSVNQADIDNQQRPDYSEIWDVKPFKESQFWFMNVDTGEDALSALRNEPEPLPELCIVDVPSIVIVIETGFGYYTYPMLIMRSKMNAEVRNWSSEMSVSSTLSLGMSYYNSRMAIWEPIIEPNEVELSNGLSEYIPWELNFSLKIDKSIDDPTTEEVEAKTLIAVSSSDTLEVTVTKTCLEVLQDLSKSFSDALSHEGLKQPDIVAPYILVNDTGFDVKLLLNRGALQLHSVQNASENTQCIVAPGDRAYLNAKEDSRITLDSTRTNSSLPDMFLHVMISDINKELELPVHRADRRYFPLYRDTKQEPWGIISHVKTEYGSTVITIHGVLMIQNHFSISVNMFRRRDLTYHPIGTVAPGETFNVPLHALYADQKELYFNISGYQTSIQGVDWKESPNDFEFTKVLQCDPERTYEPFYMKVIRERQEVYHEVTSKFTMLSACYIFHLKPPMYVRNALPINIHISVSGCSVAQAADEATEANESTNGSVLRDTEPHMSHRSVSSQQQDFLDYGEKIIGPGDILHLPTVRTTVKEGETRSFIVARLVQYLEKDWSCSTQIPEDPPEVAVWTFNSYDSVNKMSIQLGVKFEKTNGSIQLIVYCPYWMVNKTGLMLSYRKSRKSQNTQSTGSPKPAEESVNVLYHPPDLVGPILFSYREKAFFGKKKATVRVETGDWSDKFGLDAAGSTGVVECHFDGITHEIAVHNTLTSNSLTKQIVFMPMYVMINNASFPIEVQEDQRPGDSWLRIEPDQCVPLWPKAKSDRMLRIKTPDDLNASAPFRYNDVQNSLLRISNKYGGINVDVQRTEGGVFITFTEYNPGDAPVRIVNHTSREIQFWEKGNVNTRSVPSFHDMLYTWADPAGQRLIFWEDNDKHIENDLRRDGLNKFAPPSSTSSPMADSDSYWVSFLDGTQRVLMFTNNQTIATEANSANRLDKVTQEIEIDIHGIGFSLVNNLRQVDIMYIGLASSGVIWEEKKKKRYYKALKIAEVQDLEERYQEYIRNRSVGAVKESQFGLNDGSIVNIEPDGHMVWHKTKVACEVRRTFYPGLWVLVKSSPHQLQLHAKINRIQIDNQLVDCIFPVVLAPVPPPKSVAATTELKPFIECSIVQRIVPHSAVKQFKYLTVLIQEFHVKVDLLFINAIVDMVSTEITDEEALILFNQDIASLKAPLSSFAITRSTNEQKNFYDQIHLGPLKIHISFSMAGLEPGALPGVLSTILQGVGVTLTDINDIVFRLAFFEREYTFFTHPQLTSEIVSHYANQAVKQAYVLILGLDVIGNPYGLVVGLTKGVEDLFYEPFQGAIQGPGEFAEGLALGMRSLFGHTVGGAAGAVSKITGAMGKGLAVLTFDDDYQKKRRKQFNKKPTNLQEGLARSGKGLVMGVYDGVTGVITKPISGAQAEGVGGFFKGLGKGAVGLVARPTAGIADFASGSLDAVRRAADMSVDVMRLRPRRLLQSDGIVRPFSHPEAEGNRLLREVEKSKYSNSDSFVEYHVIVVKREVILLTDHRILYCVRNDIFGGWQVDWTYRWNEISHVRAVESGIEILFGESNKKILGLFGSRQQAKKLILIQKNAKQHKIVSTMQALKQNSA